MHKTYTSIKEITNNTTTIKTIDQTKIETIIINTLLNRIKKNTKHK